MQRAFRLRVWLIASCCLFLAGCVTKSAGETGTSFHYSRWLPLGVLVAGVAFVPIGIALRKHSARFGWALMILGPIAAVGFAPSLLMEGVVVDDRGFDVRSGLWGMSANQTVEFEAVASLRIAQEETGGRHSRTIDVLYFQLKSGGSARLPLNNDVKIEAAKEIVARAQQTGIPLIGFRGAI